MSYSIDKVKFGWLAAIALVVGGLFGGYVLAFGPSQVSALDQTADVVSGERIELQIDEIAQIGEFRAEVDKFVGSMEQPNAVFADVSDHEKGGAEVWRRFSSAAELETFRERSETYSMANVWLKNEQPVFCVFTFWSPSGDWAKYVRLYFREDGSLAYSNSELRTFHGNFVVEQEFYFDRNARQLKHTTAYRNLTTDQPTKPDTSDLNDNKPLIAENNFYLSTSKLPFWTPIQKILTVR